MTGTGKRLENYAEKVNLNKKELLLFIWNILVSVHLGILIIRYIYALVFLQEYIISNNPIYILLSAIVPAVVWVFSTTTDFWNFHNRKMRTITIVALNAILSVVQPLHTLLWKLLITKIFQLQPNEVLTQSMILMLGRVALIIPNIIIALILVLNVFQPLFSDAGKEKITSFKLKNYVDTRKNKENLYDMTVVKELTTGQDVIIKENDRFTHTLINGVSGTGKTSSTMVVAIYNDLCKKVNNRNKRQRALAQMVINNKAEVRRPLPQDIFEDPIIVPRKKYVKEYMDIVEKYPDCGVSVMAPNCGLTDDVITICEALGITPSVIDPMPDEVTHKAKKYLTGMNPFYVNPRLKQTEKTAQIFEKATAFADTMQAIYDTSGSQDAYFAGINLAVSVNICVVCMLGVPLIDKTPRRICTIDDVQRCMNDFTQLSAYVVAIEKKYFSGMSVKVADYNKNTQGAINTQEAQSQSKARKNAMTVSETELKEKMYKNPYYQTIYFVRQELLGVGKEKMFDQARGLRNMINNFLANPRVKKLLTMDKYIDYDKYLKKGRVTVVNTALEISTSTSTAFGSFFMLNFKQAVFRRPKKPRINHFWYIDEFPVYINKETEAMFSLFRQYRVGMSICIQTLDQFNKTAAIKYLQGVVMGCATHIVFGRLSPTDMKVYQEKAGMIEYEMEQATYSHNASVLTANDKATESVRTTKQRKNLMEGHDMSLRDFQEVTIFTVDNGRPKEPVFGKVAFLSKSAFKKRPLQTIAWKNLIFEENKPEAKKYTKADIKVNEERKQATKVLKNSALAEQEVVVVGEEDADIRKINIDNEESRQAFNNINNVTSNIKESDLLGEGNNIQQSSAERKVNVSHEEIKRAKLLAEEEALNNVDD